MNQFFVCLMVSRRAGPAGDPNLRASAWGEWCMRHHEHWSFEPDS